MNEASPCNWSPYSCQSLLGYGKAAHDLSQGVCVYCGFGRGGLTFDLWRQLTVDHVIPTISVGAGGWKRIRACFPNLTGTPLKEVYRKINEINLVTACSFCNSMTSRMKIGTIGDIIPSEEHLDAVDIGHPAVQEMLRRLAAAVKEFGSKKHRYVDERLDMLEDVYRKEVEKSHNR
jgi:hypothetical protein